VRGRGQKTKRRVSVVGAALASSREAPGAEGSPSRFERVERKKREGAFAPSPWDLETETAQYA